MDFDSRFPKTTVMSSCTHARSDRNFAAVQLRPLYGHVVYLCDDLAEQPITRIRGVLWHEAGHIICDVLGLPESWEPPAGVGLDDEQQTDLAVFAVCGVRIYYDDDLVQRAGPGARGYTQRPGGLR